LAVESVASFGRGVKCFPEGEWVGGAVDVVKNRGDGA